MNFMLSAACASNKGRIRGKHEDNFYFDGKSLEEVNSGLKHAVTFTASLQDQILVGVFDGIGGENYGEKAAFSAAERLKSVSKKLDSFIIPEKQFLYEVCDQLNMAVREKQEEMCTDHMGTTMALLLFSHNSVYSCNIGDSRAYRLREKEFIQLSEDHVLSGEGISHRKAPLIQYLGLDPEEVRLEPYVAKGELKYEDKYLLCSDGLTDMLTNMEIEEIMETSESAEECVDRLVDAALANGGRDNITVIVCIINQPQAVSS